MPTPLTTTAANATLFKSLHTPGTPLLLANVYDAASARIIAAHPKCKALATASYAFAQSLGKTDETLTLDDNLSFARPVAAVAAELGLPLTLDLQDGYAGPGDWEKLRGVVEVAVAELGAVGMNLEDSWHESVPGPDAMMSEEEAVGRIKTVVRTARELGVGDFVVNARSDTFLMGGSLDESIRRGKVYLEAGATGVFIFWPRTAEMVVEDVQRVIDELQGRVNMSCRLGKGLTTADLARMGVARISVGPQLYLAAVGARETGHDEEGVADVLREKAGEVFGCEEKT